MDKELKDCLIVGGGPAGLTAAIYLARFHLDLVVVDAGKGRASSIPCTRNVPGFADGISGEELLQRMRKHAGKYGAAIVRDRVARIEVEDGIFTATFGQGTLRARSVLIATGVSNRRPDMDEHLHDQALARGLIRYCPICDGYEVTDRKVGVIGSGTHGVAEAAFLRSYSDDVTLIAPGMAHELGPDDRRKLEEMGIRAVDGPARAVAARSDRIVVEAGERNLEFDTLYPALGSDVHVELALQLGADLNPDTGCIRVDSHQRTNVHGVYAAGDVVIGLDQISHAMGEGGVAATTIRNDLARARPLVRSAPD